MPQSCKEELVAILNECERQVTWPKALLTGFVHSLAKVELAQKVNQFRRVIIFSAVYRSWGSPWSKSFLRHLYAFVDETQIGFIPGREVSELWLLLQGIIELGLLEGQDYVGFVSDLKKAFEALPRDPIWALSEHLGLPDPISEVWQYFLAHTERRFLVAGEVGNGLTSNHGYPEGCSLSCTAMTVAGISLHRYMQEFGKMCSTLSYVDNLELVSIRLFGIFKQASLRCKRGVTFGS